MRPLPDADDVGKFCYARACTAKRQGEYVMCAPHWALVPPHVQRVVTRALGRWRRSHTAPGVKAQLHAALSAAKVCVDVAERAAMDRQRLEAASARARR